jgi:hypothetical protein
MLDDLLHAGNDVLGSTRAKKKQKNGGATNHQDGPSIFDHKGNTKSTASPFVVSFRTQLINGQ